MVTFLRRLALVEAFSTLILFVVAMPLKYLFGIPEVVTGVGWIHGLLFMSVWTLFVYAGGRRLLGWKTVIGGMVSAILPFGPLWAWVDVRLRAAASPN